jgi:hypothetical protein
MSRFGVVQADTVITNTIIAATYTPGAGNIPEHEHVLLLAPRLSSPVAGNPATSAGAGAAALRRR